MFFYESPSVRKFHCVLLTLRADVSSLCCCFPLGTLRPPALSLWAASKMVIIINMGFGRGNTGGLEEEEKKGKKIHFHLDELFSPVRQRKLPTSHSLVLSWDFRRHFYSFILGDIWFKTYIYNTKKTWGEFVWAGLVNPCWLACFLNSYFHTIIHNSYFKFFPQSGNI